MALSSMEASKLRPGKKNLTQTKAGKKPVLSPRNSGGGLQRGSNIMFRGRGVSVATRGRT